jgi:hypothetical protein
MVGVEVGPMDNPIRPQLTKWPFFTHKEISVVSENPLSRLSAIYRIPTRYFG